MAFSVLQKLLQFEVRKIARSCGGDLVLSFRESAETLYIAAPWTFSSCLAGIPSGEWQDSEDPSGLLIGLVGATFSGYRSGRNRIDLQFDSITLSASAVSDNRRNSMQ